MRKTALLLPVLLIPVWMMAQGISFFHGSWAEALEAAKKEEKIIFVDAFAEWCGPCKRMAATVFTQAEVGDYFNSHFINVKLDMEKGEGLNFRKKYPVSAFPTLFFIDYSGEMVHKIVGAQQADNLIQLGKFALSKVDHSKEFELEYENGNREPALVYNYVKALNKAGKSSAKVANDYLRNQKDLTTPENLRFILEAAVECDSRIYDLLIKHRVAVAAATSDKEVNARIETACRRTVQKGIEFQTPDLVEEAKRKMQQHYPQHADAFAAQADMDLARTNKDAKAYLKTAAAYGKKLTAAAELHQLARDMSNAFDQDAKIMKQSEEFALKAAELTPRHDYYYFAARVMLLNGKKSEAMQAAQKALKLSDNAPAPEKDEIERFIQTLNS